MAFIGALSGVPIVDAAEERQNVAAENTPTTPGFAKTNSFAVPAGPEPARGWVLVSRIALDTLDLNGRHTLTFAFRNNSGVITQSITWQNLVIAREPSTVDSALVPAAPETVCLVELADVRHLLKNTMPPYNGPTILTQYNVRAPAYQGASDDTKYYASSLNAGAHWTWSTMIGDIWATMSVELGSFPGLPFSPDGVPEGWYFQGVLAYDALTEVLTRIGCELKPDLTQASGQQFRIVQIGTADATSDATLAAAELASLKIFDAEYQSQYLGTVPYGVKVLFHRQENYGGVEQTGIQTSAQWITSNVYSVPVVGPYSNYIESGIYAPIYDDLPAIYDVSNAITNAAACATRAAERCADYFRMYTGLGGGRLWKRYSGLLSITAGSTLKGVRWIAQGDVPGSEVGIFTEIIRTPSLWLGISDGGEWQDCCASATKLHTPNLRPAWPNYPGVAQVIELSSATINADGYYPATVEKRDASGGTWVDKENCWGLDLAGATSGLTVGRRYNARLCGYKITSGDGRPEYAFDSGPTSSSGGTLTVNLHVYFANTTWTKPANLVCAEIWVQGDGGGGGGAWSGASWPGASGGGAGGFAYDKLNAAALSATESITVGSGGAGGVGGSGSPTDGGTGTGSSFGSHMTVNGGAGGPSNGTNSSFVINSGAVPSSYGVIYSYTRTASTPGGTSSGGSLNIAGGDGGVGTALIDGGATNGISSGGAGGASPFGAGGAMGIALNAAAGYGSGGAGASFLKQTGTANYSGGAGAGGVVIVKEYIFV